VTVANSTFSYNNHSGLKIASAGPVTLNSVIAMGNGGQRDLSTPESAHVEDHHHAGMIWDDIRNVEDPDWVAGWAGSSQDNWFIPPEPNDDPYVSPYVIDDATYYQHVWWGSGVDVLALAGDVLVQDSLFGINTDTERNNYNGLIVEATSGNITLDGVTAEGNFNTGADLTAKAGNIVVTDS